MAQHIDTMGFVLAAIVISISLLGDREARRSENQTNEIRKNSSALSEALTAGRPLPPSRVSEMVRQAMAQRDDVVRAARLLNSLLIGVVVIFGIDALRLIFLDHAEHPEDGLLLVIGLMVSAVGTGLYGEYHARVERRNANTEFQQSELGKLSKLSDALETNLRGEYVEGLIASIRDQYPRWGLIPEIQAISYLRRGETEQAVGDLRQQHEQKMDGYNFPVLFATCMMRLGTVDQCEPVLEEWAAQHPESRMLDELLFSFGLASAHRGCLFGNSPFKIAAATGAGLDRLSFDLSVDDFPETSGLARFGRAWSHGSAQDASLIPKDSTLPITWLWQLLSTGEVEIGFDGLADWRNNSRDAAALESMGFGLLATGRGDEAVEMFDAAIRVNSSSASGHWGWALSYFDRSWTDKAITGLKRARTCGLSDGWFQLTEVWFHSQELPSAERTLQILGTDLTLQDRADLSLLGREMSLKHAISPQDIFISDFLAASRRTHANRK